MSHSSARLRAARKTEWNRAPDEGDKSSAHQVAVVRGVALVGVIRGGIADRDQTIGTRRSERSGSEGLDEGGTGRECGLAESATYLGPRYCPYNATNEWS
jgi:hypothetical protein